MRILVVAKNRKKNTKNVRTTVARGARMNLIAKNAPYTRTPILLKRNQRKIDDHGKKNKQIHFFVVLGTMGK